MKHRRPVLLLVVCGLAALAGRFLVAHADTTPGNLGKPIADFTLPDARNEGTPVALANFKAQKPVVVAFVGTESPINNAFLPRLNELHKQNPPPGAQFLPI